MCDRDELSADDWTTFYVDAIPKPQPRHQIGVVAGKAMAFEAPKSHPIHVFKLAVREAAIKASNGRPRMDGPIVLETEIVLPRPASMTRKTKPNPSVLHHKLGDVDNYAKAIMDAMDGIFWANDCQVAKLYAAKWYAAGDERPHCKITVGPARTKRSTRK
ncbi:MAG: RusA family crossover junction endodeoxyribonuclease [Pirellulales bacterium]|nr:RusA family crossover junction endodeoxyribonuclease [Pirellulales bacterium]